MPLKMLLLIFAFKAFQIFCKPGKFQQLLVRQNGVFIDYDMLLHNLTKELFTDATACMVVRL